MTSFHPYEFSDSSRRLLRAFGVRKDLDGVRVADDHLHATFGFFNVRVDLDNISSAIVTGPYRWFTAIGPRLSMADHGLTFGTTSNGGACLRFADPIARVIGPWPHPGLTLTVRDPVALVQAIEASRQ